MAGGDNNCQTSAPFLAFFSMLLNERYYKSHQASGNIVINYEGDSYIEKQCKNLLLSNYNLILTGAPGTGKSYLAKKIAHSIVSSCGGEVKFVQFHPSYDYTDFVEGLRPIKDANQKEIGFVRKDGVFKSLCKEAISNPSGKYIIIIDEINRGEISKILGELFFSIDPGYRGCKEPVETQYQNMIEPSDVFAQGFYVPDNVYILGTMNDIDRSVDSMDFAIRRRFSWKEITYLDTAESILDSSSEIQEYRGMIEERMNNLNHAILNADLNLGSAYQLGASYYLKIKNYINSSNPNQMFQDLWNYHIKGVLFEYLRGSEDPESGLKIFKDSYELEKCFDENGNIVEKKQEESNNTDTTTETDVHDDSGL